jgi:DNA (cytosine-5)-methyltransferase 1
MARSHHSVEFENLRLKTGLSRSETADLLGVTERTIIRYEDGDSRPSPIAIKWLQEHLAKQPDKRRKPAAFKFIDLFAGIGGLRLGFDAIGGQCVFTSEWDKYCQITYRENFGSDHPIAGDMRDYSKDPSLIPSHDAARGVPMSAILDCRRLKKERARKTAWLSLRYARHPVL